MKAVLAYSALALGTVGLVIALDVGGIFYQKATSGIRGKAEAERIIESGSSRIQRYQEFFNICQGVQAKEDAIDNLLANKTMDTVKRDTAVTANQNARATLIADYNSKSAQAYTAARFKASNLPYQINRGPYNGSNRTNCAIQ